MAFVRSLVHTSSGLAPPTFPWGAALIGALTGVGSALLGSCVAALLAARVDVATALRE